MVVLSFDQNRAACRTVSGHSLSRSADHTLAGPAAAWPPLSPRHGQQLGYLPHRRTLTAHRGGRRRRTDRSWWSYRNCSRSTYNGVPLESAARGHGAEGSEEVTFVEAARLGAARTFWRFIELWASSRVVVLTDARNQGWPRRAEALSRAWRLAPRAERSASAPRA